MRNSKHRNGGEPPFIDPAFAEALGGSNKSSSRNRNKDHKAQQMCRQVQRVLNLVLNGESGDDLLRELYVAEVRCAAGASNVLVHVIVPRHIGVVDVLSRLERIAPRLRAEVARSITRKRAPELTFIPGAAQEESP